MQISVLPDMSVEVVAPLSATDEAIRHRIGKRAAWILRQIQFSREFHPRTPERRYVAGETHLYLGRRYRLKVQRSVKPQVKVKGSYIEVHTYHPDSKDGVRLQVEAWIKERAHDCFNRRLEACLTHFSCPDDFRPRAMIVRQLKQRWGSMSPSGRLVLNRALIQATVREIDYVITHELCHRAFHHHRPEFFGLLTRVMPDWKARKLSLERRLA